MSFSGQRLFCFQALPDELDAQPVAATVAPPVQAIPPLDRPFLGLEAVAPGSQWQRRRWYGGAAREQLEASLRLPDTIRRGQGGPPHLWGAWTGFWGQAGFAPVQQVVAPFALHHLGQLCTKVASPIHVPGIGALDRFRQPWQARFYRHLSVPKNIRRRLSNWFFLQQTFNFP